jgi:hypothetical protein
MNEPDISSDQQFDEFLREVGPEVPQPTLDDRARARLMAWMDHADAHSTVGRIGQSSGKMKWVAAAGTSIAAVLGLALALQWVSLSRVREQLSTSQWQTDEVLQLLMNARRTQPIIPAPEEIEGVSSADLVLITFHHDLCPLARPCTPQFRDMEQRHKGEAARFIAFDVTGSKRNQVEREIDDLGMRFALLGPAGAETGVVKVIDATHQRVLSSAPGKQGLEQAESLLALVSGRKLRQ